MRAAQLLPSPTNAMLKFYQQQPSDAPAFPFDQALYQRLHQTLSRHNLIVPEPNQRLEGVSVQILFDELMAFGFDSADILTALQTIYSKKELVSNTDPSDVYKNTFFVRMEQARQRVMQLLLLTLPAQRIPEELGGSKASVRLNYLSTSDEKVQTEQQMNLIKPNERKPRRWRTKADESTVESAEQAAQRFANCQKIVEQTQMVSPSLVRQVVEACQSEELCYATAISSVMGFVRGFPKIPRDVERDKLQNTVRELRRVELQLLQASGFDCALVTKATPRENRPKCFDILGYDSIVVKYAFPFAPYAQATIVIQMQPPEDVEEMTVDKIDWKTMPEQPLAVDQNCWKQNLQFRGAYPFCIPFIDVESKQLSQYGKALLLKHLYGGVQGRGYNKQPVLQALLQLNEPGLEQSFRQTERALQQSIRASTLNTKKFQKEELLGSYFFDIAKELQNVQKARNVRPVVLTPLLFACAEVEAAVARIKSSLPEGTSYLFIEDQFEPHKKELVVAEPLAFNAPKAQQLDVAQQPMELDTKQSKPMAPMSKERFDRTVASRNVQQYAQFLQQRDELPVVQKRDEVLKVIRENQIVILTAETGTGKSSNIPQLIIEAGEPCRIVITQPRKIAAISLAQRVAQESGLKLGGGIGYSVKGKAEYSDETLALYCTIGVLVRRVIMNPEDVFSYSHIIIDEVHERDQNTDVFLGILKHIYATEKTRALPKLIIMSATLDGEKFAGYFAGNVTGRYAIKGKQFKIAQFFLDDLLQLRAYFEPKAKKPAREQASALDDYLEDDYADGQLLLDDAYQTYNRVDEVDDSKVSNDVIRAVIQERIYTENAPQGATLVFLPGAYEIEQLQKHLSKALPAEDYEILACHAMLSLDEQQRLFRPGRKQRRIILATNIAEASVTIPGVIAVIDTGLERQVSFQPKQRKHVFTTKFISQESAKQRMGRAGRVCDGAVFCCYSRERYESLDKHRKPELVTGNLFNAVMQLSLLAARYPQGSELRRLFQPHIFLANSMDRPGASRLAATIKELVDSGYLMVRLNSFLQNGEKQTQLNQGYETYMLADSTELQLTQFGGETAFLPIEPFYGQILLQARRLGASQALAAQLVAVLSVGQNQILKKGPQAVQSSLNKLDPYSDFGVMLRLLQRALAHQNVTQFGASPQGIQSAVDTYYDICDDTAEKRFSDADFALINAALQLAVHPSVLVASGRGYAMLQNKNVNVRIHNSSVIARDGHRIVFFNEILQTNGQNYAVGCATASLVALLISALNDRQIDVHIDFRRRTLCIGSVEINIMPLHAAVIIAACRAANAYGLCAAELKTLIQREAGK